MSKSIYKKIINAKGNFGVLRKDKENPFHKSKYASLDNIMACIEKPLEDEGLYLFHTQDETVVKTIVLDSESGESIETSIAIVGAIDMQKMGSAITYARRYGIVQLLALTVDEDDDGNAISGLGRNYDKEIEELQTYEETKEYYQCNAAFLNKKQIANLTAKGNKLKGE